MQDIYTVHTPRQVPDLLNMTIEMKHINGETILLHAKAKVSFDFACNIKCQVEVSPSNRSLLGPFSSQWLLAFATLFSLASTEHLL